nr:hypothetical protein [uncultured Roseococcus sp.]
MAANMRGPKPVDPLYYRWADTLEVRCQRCGNSARATVQAWAMWHQLNDRLRFTEMQERMVCLRCGTYAPRMEIHERR